MIAQLGRMLRDRKCSCIELTNTYLSAIERENPALGAFITLTREVALSTARAIDARIAAGDPLSPLAGIPMTLKDNLSTQGIETTCASRMLSGYIPAYNATVWSLLQAQGAVLLGKSNMDEFAMGSSGETSCYGGTANPHDPAYVAGGSSSGGAAAVGGGLAVYALGSDTGGSVRVPAAFCGVVGFKPTYGAISRYGLIAHASSLDHIGLIAASVEDTALVFDTLAYRDPYDATSLSPISPTASALQGSLSGVVIGLPRVFRCIPDTRIQAAYDDAISIYKRLGARLIELDIPLLTLAPDAYLALSCAEAASNLARYDGIRYGSRIADDISQTRTAGFGAEVKRRILLGNCILREGEHHASLQKAHAVRAAICNAFDTAFQSCELILTPATPSVAFLRGQSDPHADRYAVPVNLAGLPAISVPSPRGTGLPISIQLIGSARSEAAILSAAYAYERETGGEASKSPML